MQLMDGSYTAVMTYFDVACQSRPISDSEQKPLENCNASFLKNLFMSRCENKEMASLPLSSPERHNLDFLFFFFFFYFL